jgi:hypothetical protein
MTLYEFNLLPYERQLVAVFNTGTFLARRWEEEDGINLYHLPGEFFVELYYDIHANELVRLHSFTSAAPLENYTLYVQLPDELGC